MEAELVNHDRLIPRASLACGGCDPDAFETVSQVREVDGGGYRFREPALSAFVRGQDHPEIDWRGMQAIRHVGSEGSK